MPPRAETAADADAMSPELAPPVRQVVARAASRSIPAVAEVSSPIAPVIGLSLVAHVVVAVALGALGPIPVLALTQESFVELEVPLEPVAEPAVIPPPEPLPEPEPLVVPSTPRLRPETPRPQPEAAAPPPPEPTAAPPSLDDVFGAEPAPAAEVMAATSGGGPAMDLGTAGGVSGGRGQGHGTATGEGIGTAGEGSTGPSEADRRRARRAYVRSLEGMLGGRARYPRALERAGVGGRVELCIRIGNDGRVLGSRVCGSAGHDQLDDAALAAASGLDRVPAPPELAAWSPSDEIHAGVVFAVR